MNTTSTEGRRIKFNRYGMLENPVGLQVKLPWSKHVAGFILGDVRGFRIERAPHGGEQIVLDVRHFNGEAWPVAPLARLVEVIG
jgi:hypothetical protein